VNHRHAPSALACAALLLAVALTGCSLTPPGPQFTTYDLGPAGTAATAATAATTPRADAAPLPKLRIAQTEGPAWMEGSALYYRLQYSQAQRLQAYATQRWVMSPPQLFDGRLREAVAARGALTWSGDTTQPAMKVDLLSFEQVFDSATASRGVVRVRVTVYHHGLIGQRTFIADQPAPSADGAGGVRALADSTNAVIAAILEWVSTLPMERTTAPATSHAPSAPVAR